MTVYRMHLGNTAFSHSMWDPLVELPSNRLQETRSGSFCAA